MQHRIAACIVMLLMLTGCQDALHSSQHIASNYVSLYDRYVIWPCNSNEECVQLRTKDYNKMVKNEDILLQ